MSVDWDDIAARAELLKATPVTETLVLSDEECERVLARTCNFSRGRWIPSYGMIAEYAAELVAKLDVVYRCTELGGKDHAFVRDSAGDVGRIAYWHEDEYGERVPLSSKTAWEMEQDAVVVEKETVTFGAGALRLSRRHDGAGVIRAVLRDIGFEMDAAARMPGAGMLEAGEKLVRHPEYMKAVGVCFDTDVRTPRVIDDVWNSIPEKSLAREDTGKNVQCPDGQVFVYSGEVDPSGWVGSGCDEPALRRPTDSSFKPSKVMFTPGCVDDIASVSVSWEGPVSWLGVRMLRALCGEDPASGGPLSENVCVAIAEGFALRKKEFALLFTGAADAGKSTFVEKVLMRMFGTRGVMGGQIGALLDRKLFTSKDDVHLSYLQTLIGASAVFLSDLADTPAINVFTATQLISPAGPVATRGMGQGIVDGFQFRPHSTFILQANSMLGLEQPDTQDFLDRRFIGIDCVRPEDALYREVGERVEDSASEEYKDEIARGLLRYCLPLLQAKSYKPAMSDPLSRHWNAALLTADAASSRGYVAELPDLIGGGDDDVLNTTELSKMGLWIHPMRYTRILREMGYKIRRYWSDGKCKDQGVCPMGSANPFVEVHFPIEMQREFSLPPRCQLIVGAKHVNEVGGLPAAVVAWLRERGII